MSPLPPPLTLLLFSRSVPPGNRFLFCFRFLMCLYFAGLCFQKGTGLGFRVFKELVFYRVDRGWALLCCERHLRWPYSRACGSCGGKPVVEGDGGVSHNLVLIDKIYAASGGSMSTSCVIFVCASAAAEPPPPTVEQSPTLKHTSPTQQTHAIVTTTRSAQANLQRMVAQITPPHSPHPRSSKTFCRRLQEPREWTCGAQSRRQQPTPALRHRCHHRRCCRRHCHHSAQSPSRCPHIRYLRCHHCPQNRRPPLESAEACHHLTKHWGWRFK